MTGRRSGLLAIPAGAAAVVLLVALSVGSSSSSPESAGGEEGGGAASVTPLEVVGVDGDRIRLPAGRPGALFFTVSSCLSCIPSAQALGEFEQRFGDRLDAVWIGIDPTEPLDLIRDLRERMGTPPYPFAIDTSGTLAGRYRIAALGTAIVYDGEGRIVAQMIEPTADQFDQGFRDAGLP